MQLLAFERDAKRRLPATGCGYTESSGSPELREAIAALYLRAARGAGPARDDADGSLSRRLSAR
jgi:aspartate/methionine/tyrosine aminotransferase